MPKISNKELETVSGGGPKVSVSRNYDSTKPAIIWGGAEGTGEEGVLINVDEYERYKKSGRSFGDVSCHGGTDLPTNVPLVPQ